MWGKGNFVCQKEVEGHGLEKEKKEKKEKSKIRRKRKNEEKNVKRMKKS